LLSLAITALLVSVLLHLRWGSYAAGFATFLATACWLWPQPALGRVDR
jgi:hypothetical protein